MQLRKTNLKEYSREIIRSLSNRGLTGCLSIAFVGKSERFLFLALHYLETLKVSFSLPKFRNLKVLCLPKASSRLPLERVGCRSHHRVTPSIPSELSVLETG